MWEEVADVMERGGVQIPDHVWEHPETYAALKSRDIGRLFQLLRRYAGLSQTAIGAATGHSQSTVSKIANGFARVEMLEVFERIADGLGMPDDARMALGLAPRDDGRRAAVAVNEADMCMPLPHADPLMLPRRSFVADLEETYSGTTRPFTETVSSANVPAIVAMLAHEAARLGADVDSTPFGPFTLDEITRDLRELATKYPHIAPVESLLQAAALRDRAFAMAKRSRRPSDTRDLYLITAWSCAMLANASFDLGEVQAAFRHARTAMQFGDLSEHRGLRIWTSGLRL
jgi:transcriptional regulator with XRE-family HTH domain